MQPKRKPNKSYCVWEVSWEEDFYKRPKGSRRFFVQMSRPVNKYFQIMNQTYKLLYIIRVYKKELDNMAEV